MPLYDFTCQTCNNRREDVVLKADDAEWELEMSCTGKCQTVTKHDMVIPECFNEDWGNAGQGVYIEAVDKTFHSKGAWKQYARENGLKEKRSYV